MTQREYDEGELAGLEWELASRDGTRTTDPVAAATHRAEIEREIVRLRERLPRE